MKYEKTHPDESKFVMDTADSGAAMFYHYSPSGALMAHSALSPADVDDLMKVLASR